MAGRTPAKRAPRKTTAPAVARRPRVVLDLDALDKRKVFPDLDLPRDPFTFLLDGHSYELKDPRDPDWKMSVQMATNPFLLMRHSLSGADDPITDPSADEMIACRERHGLPQEPPAAGTPAAAEEAELHPGGVTPALIDRFTMAYCPGWKLQVLFTRWHEHYKIDLAGADGILGALLGKRE